MLIGAYGDARWLHDAKVRPHSARSARGRSMSSDHTAIIDIEHCISEALHDDFAAKAVKIEQHLMGLACVGTGKVVVHCNRGANSTESGRRSPRLVAHCGVCAYGRFPECPRCRRPAFGLNGYPRRGAFEVSLTLVVEPLALAPDAAFAERLSRTACTRRTKQLGPVKLTSRLASNRLPSTETIADRFAEQCVLLLALRADSVPDPWPYHPMSRVQFAHVSRLPLLRGQEAEMRRESPPSIAQSRPASRPTSAASTSSGGIRGYSALSVVGGDAPANSEAMADADAFIRKSDPGIRDHDAATWAWTEDEVNWYVRWTQMGGTPEVETWMTAGGREREPYRYNTGDAYAGRLNFRPRRITDRTNVGIPIAPAAAIVATSKDLRAR